MNRAEAFFHFAARPAGQGHRAKTAILPVELKCGKFDLWPAFAAAYASLTGLLENIDGTTVRPTDANAIVRCGYITAGSDIQDAEALLELALNVLREARATTAAAYAQGRPPTPDIDATSIAVECDDMPHPGRRGRPYKKGDKDRDDHT